MTTTSEEWSALLESLSNDLDVYVSSGPLEPAGGPNGLTKAVAEKVHSLLAMVHEKYPDKDTWYERAYERAGLVPVPQIEASLYPKTQAEAVSLLGELASTPLLFPQYPIMDRAVAESTAAQLVGLLGSEAHWWSTRDDFSVDSLTCCSIDCLVVGTDGHRFAALIQVCED
ncbi:hypothetical protein ACIBO9_08600 [Streptomyces prunicolor]|uniref:hypothetical protein n=1 Tax=Streptomyces prunicolor TaxID=67348 RepID=UPI0037CEFE3A